MTMQKKRYQPRSSAYVPIQTLIAIEKQEPPRHALLMRIMRIRGCRLSDLIGIVHKYDLFHGLRPCDIDVVKKPYAKHTMTLIRKKEKFKVMTLPDSIYAELQKQIEEYGIKPTERIFPYERSTVWRWYNKYGLKCIDERYNLSPHCVRRSYAHDYVQKGGSVASLQKHLSHTRPGQTYDYLGEDEDAANKEQMEFDNMEAGN